MQDGPALEPSSVPYRRVSGVYLVLEVQRQRLVFDVLDTIRVFFLSILFSWLGPRICILAWVGLGLVGLWPIAFVPPACLPLPDSHHSAPAPHHTRHCFVPM
jgi:hypothetical protein